MISNRISWEQNLLAFFTFILRKAYAVTGFALFRAFFLFFLVLKAESNSALYSSQPLCFYFREKLNPYDSIGQIVENGIVFLLYKVEAGETIFKISQKYDVTTLEIREANNLPNYDIEVGQILKIPRRKIILNEKVPIKHVIAHGDNLYSISKKYEVSIKQIIEWNDLKDFTLPEGKSLIVGYKIEKNVPENDYVPAVLETDIKPREPEKLNQLPPTAFAYPSFDKKKNKKYYEVSEIGEIVVSQNPLLNPHKLECLHDVVPVGKLIEVTHLVTGRSVFVEVVGKKSNSNVILEVTEKVLDYLGVQNPKSFKTTILYRWEE